MPPKKGSSAAAAAEAQQSPMSPESANDVDPAVNAAREAAERQAAEDRKIFERNELIARRRVEAMESVGWKCVLSEKERRLDPEAWAQRTATKGPMYIYVKTLTGNRAVPQQAFRVIINSEMTVLLLKNAIRDEAVKLRLHEKPESYFDPSRQRLQLFGKDVPCEDEYNLTLKAAGILSGTTVHLSLHSSAAHEIMPSMVL